MGESGEPEHVGLVCRRWLATHETAVCIAREFMIPNLTRLQGLSLSFDSFNSFRPVKPPLDRPSCESYKPGDDGFYFSRQPFWNRSPDPSFFLY